LALTVLVIGLVSGAGRAAAGSLPSDALYRLKVLGAEAGSLPGPGEPVQQETQARALEQVRSTLGAASQAGLLTQSRLLQRLEVMLQARLQKMGALADCLPEPLQQQVRLLLREMERVRTEAHAGQGDPEGEQSRQRLGTPQDAPPGEPQGPKGPGQPGDAPGTQPAGSPGQGPGTQPADGTGQGPGTQPADQPGQDPGSQPAVSPGAPVAPQMPGGGPGTDPSGDPGHGSGPGPGSSPAQGGGGKQKP
jgi:hypothetical protein